jgi:hypothetical protein
MNKKLLLVSIIAVAVLAILLVPRALHLLNNQSLKITYLQEFEIADYSPELIAVKGTYTDSVGSVNIVSLECRLLLDTCTEVLVFITDDGVTGIVDSKEYTIIEKSPTRIVARYDGFAAFHMFTIDLATKKATFKNEAYDNPSDVGIYDLVDGNSILMR